MQIWMTLILAVQLLSALAMIGLVLIQHGKGADMGASFGSGASGSLFGATGSANFLSRSTAALATRLLLLHAGPGLHRQQRQHARQSRRRQRARPRRAGCQRAGHRCHPRRRAGGRSRRPCRQPSRRRIALGRQAAGRRWISG